MFTSSWSVLSSCDRLNEALTKTSQITSFHNTSLQEVSRGKKWNQMKQQSFIPLDKASAHPSAQAGDPSYSNLTLANGKHMEKRGYVNARQIYQIDWRDIERYWGANPVPRKTYQLDPTSLARLLQVTESLSGRRAGQQYVHVLRDEAQLFPRRLSDALVSLPTPGVRTAGCGGHFHPAQLPSLVINPSPVPTSAFASCSSAPSEQRGPMVATVGERQALLEQAQQNRQGVDWGREQPVKSISPWCCLAWVGFRFTNFSKWLVGTLVARLRRAVHRLMPQ